MRTTGTTEPGTVPDAGRQRRFGSAPRRRTVLRAGAAALAGVAVSAAGCTGRDGDLRAGWWGDPGLNEAVRSAIGAFERQRSSQNVRVDTEALPWDGYWDKLATQTAGQSEPDLIMQAGTYLPEYVPRHTLLDLDPAIGERIDVSDLDPGVRDAGAYEGGTYAVIAAINSPTVICNSTALDRAGVTPPTDDWTWPELADLAGRVSHALGPDGYGVLDAGGDLIAFQVWVRQRDRELFDADGALAIGEDDLAEWLAFWERLRASGAAPPADVSAEAADDLTRSPLIRGKAAFMLGWNQDLIAADDLTEDELVLRMVPGHEGGVPGQWLNAASMWAASAHTERFGLVADLIDHLLNDERAIDALQVWLGVPPTERARERVRPRLNRTERRSLAYIERVERTSRPLPRLWPRGFTQLRDLLPRLNEDVGFGERSIPDAAARFFVEAKRVLA